MRVTTPRLPATWRQKILIIVLSESVRPSVRPSAHPSVRPSFVSRPPLPVTEAEGDAPLPAPPPPVAGRPAPSALLPTRPPPAVHHVLPVTPSSACHRGWRRRPTPCSASTGRWPPCAVSLPSNTAASSCPSRPPCHALLCLSQRLKATPHSLLRLHRSLAALRRQPSFQHGRLQLSITSSLSRPPLPVTEAEGDAPLPAPPPPVAGRPAPSALLPTRPPPAVHHVLPVTPSSACHRGWRRRPTPCSASTGRWPPCAVSPPSNTAASSCPSRPPCHALLCLSQRLKATPHSLLRLHRSLAALRRQPSFQHGRLQLSITSSLSRPPLPVTEAEGDAPLPAPPPPVAGRPAPSALLPTRPPPAVHHVLPVTPSSACHRGWRRRPTPCSASTGRWPPCAVSPPSNTAASSCPSRPPCHALLCLSQRLKATPHSLLRLHRSLAALRRQPSFQHGRLQLSITSSLSRPPLPVTEAEGDAPLPAPPPPVAGRPAPSALLPTRPPPAVHHVLPVTPSSACHRGWRRRPTPCSASTGRWPPCAVSPPSNTAASSCPSRPPCHALLCLSQRLKATPHSLLRLHRSLAALRRQPSFQHGRLQLSITSSLSRPPLPVTEAEGDAPLPAPPPPVAGRPAPSAFLPTRPPPAVHHVLPVTPSSACHRGWRRRPTPCSASTGRWPPCAVTPPSNTAASSCPSRPPCHALLCLSQRLKATPHSLLRLHRSLAALRRQPSFQHGRLQLSITSSLSRPPLPVTEAEGDAPLPAPPPPVAGRPAPSALLPTRPPPAVHHVLPVTPSSACHRGWRRRPTPCSASTGRWPPCAVSPPSNTAASSCPSRPPCHALLCLSQRLKATPHSLLRLHRSLAALRRQPSFQHGRLQLSITSSLSRPPLPVTEAEGDAPLPAPPPPVTGRPAPSALLPTRPPPAVHHVLPVTPSSACHRGWRRRPTPCSASTGRWPPCAVSPPSNTAASSCPSRPPCHALLCLSQRLKATPHSLLRLHRSLAALRRQPSFQHGRLQLSITSSLSRPPLPVTEAEGDAPLPAPPPPVAGRPAPSALLPTRPPPAVHHVLPVTPSSACHRGWRRRPTPCSASTGRWPPCAVSPPSNTAASSCPSRPPCHALLCLSQRLKATPHSLLRLHRSLAALRRQPSFQHGRLQMAVASDDVFSFIRFAPGATPYLVAINVGAHPATHDYTLSTGVQYAQLALHAGVGDGRGGLLPPPPRRLDLERLLLHPGEAVVVKLEFDMPAEGEASEPTWGAKWTALK